MVAKYGPLVAMEHFVDKLAGKTVAAEVMDGSEQITEKTDKRETAEWVKKSMEKLDATVDEKTRMQIMQNCAYNCAKKHTEVIERAVARRKKYAGVNEFLAAEQQKPTKGTRLAREGNILYQFYTPQAFTRPMQCYCSLLRGLPNDVSVSKTYCNCARGFVEKYWEAVLEKPAKVDLLQSVVSGGSECKFAIHL